MRLKLHQSSRFGKCVTRAPIRHRSFQMPATHQACTPLQLHALYNNTAIPFNICPTSVKSLRLQRTSINDCSVIKPISCGAKEDDGSTE